MRRVKTAGALPPASKAPPMLDLQPHADGTLLPVRAVPGARKAEIRGCQDGALKVAVTQQPEKGKANKALIALLSKKLGLRRSQICLQSGLASPHKVLLISDVTVAQLEQRIKQVLSGRREST